MTYKHIMFDGKERINVVDEINVANYPVLKHNVIPGNPR